MSSPPTQTGLPFGWMSSPPTQTSLPLAEVVFESSGAPTSLLASLKHHAEKASAFLLSKGEGTNFWHLRDLRSGVAVVASRKRRSGARVQSRASKGKAQNHWQQNDEVMGCEFCLEFWSKTLKKILVIYQKRKRSSTSQCVLHFAFLRVLKCKESRTKLKMKRILHLNKKRSVS